MRPLCFEHVPPARMFREGAEHGTPGACAPNACLPMLILTAISRTVRESGFDQGGRNFNERGGEELKQGLTIFV
jgi:hypothetical protein